MHSQATLGKIPKNVGLFCKRNLQNQGTYLDYIPNVYILLTTNFFTAHPSPLLQRTPLLHTPPHYYYAPLYYTPLLTMTRAFPFVTHLCVTPYCYTPSCDTPYYCTLYLTLYCTSHKLSYALDPSCRLKTYGTLACFHKNKKRGGKNTLAQNITDLNIKKYIWTYSCIDNIFTNHIVQTHGFIHINRYIYVIGS